MKLIFSMIRRHLGLFCAGIFFLTLEAVSDLLQPAMMAHIVDDGAARHDTRAVLLLGAAMAGIAAAGACGAVMRSILAGHTSQLIGKELRSMLYRKIQDFSFANLDRFPPGTLITRLTNDVTQIQHFVNGIMRILVKAPITCVGAVVLIATHTPRQIPALAAILAVSGLLIFGSMALGYPRFGRLQQKLDRINHVSREFLTSIRVVKAFGQEDAEEKRFGAAADGLAKAGVSAARVTASFTPLINLTVNLGIVALFWTRGGDPDVGKLMASVNYMTQMLFSLSMVSGLLNTMVRASASAGRIREVLEEVPGMAAPPLPEPLPPGGGVEFRNVSFAYGTARRFALENISFTVQSGETLGVIGSTGAGKSTLASLIPRFYDPSQGMVLAGGLDVRKVDPAALRRRIGLVPQKAVLFSGAIRDNLRWGDETAAEEAVREAAKAACADAFISALPQGYDTRLGQGGVNLSGGQKQRLCIARALLRRPAILILDDCTSALDATTEAAVLKGIRAHAKDATVLLVSQRVSSVMRADRILCLDDGRLRGWGSHAQLMETCDTYREIYRSQIGGEGDG